MLPRLLCFCSDLLPEQCATCNKPVKWWTHLASEDNPISEGIAHPSDISLLSLTGSSFPTADTSDIHTSTKEYDSRVVHISCDSIGLEASIPQIRGVSNEQCPLYVAQTFYGVSNYLLINRLSNWQCSFNDCKLQIPCSVSNYLLIKGLPSSQFSSNKCNIQMSDALECPTG
jgi:hypothetical protein